MSTGENEKLPLPEDLYPTDTGYRDLYDLTALGYGDGLILNTPSSRTFGSMALRADTGGEYTKEPGLLDMGSCVDGRFRQAFEWDSGEATYEYPETRETRSNRISFRDIARQADDRPDAEVLAQLPAISTDFRFVIDRRPVGQEDAYIPAREYTAYFANQQIPVAAPGHRLHAHDSLHSTTYAKAFSIPEFAEMVRHAAGNALQLPDEDGATVFTNAMDKFGDALVVDSFSSFGNSLYNDSGYVLRESKMHLQRLVGLYFKSPSEEPPALGGSETEVFDILWRKLGFEWKEMMYGERKSSLLRKYVQIEGYGAGDSEPLGSMYRDYGYVPEKPRTRETYEETDYDLSGSRAGVESGYDFGGARGITHNRYPIGGRIFQRYRNLALRYTELTEKREEEE